MNATRIHGIRHTLEGQTLFVTGVTGFLGKVFVAMVLDRVPGVKLVLLARGQRGRSAAARVQRIFERSPAFRPLRAEHGKGYGDFVRERVEVVEGDARRPFLSIDERTLGELAPRIDAVIHCAGLTDFDPDPKDAVAVNVRGAMHAADLAARTRGGKLLHVSTCFVAGQGSRVVDETLEVGVSPNGTHFDPALELAAVESVCEAQTLRHASDHVAARKARLEHGNRRALALGWPNIYTYSKALGEHLLMQREDVAARELAMTFVRPAIVECAQDFPFPGWNEGVNTSAPLVWLVGTPHRRMPFTPEHHFDVVPVDAVVRGMLLALAALLRDGAEPVYQLGTSDHNPFTLGRALDLATLARRRLYARSQDPFERFVLKNLDSVTHEHAPREDLWLPAAKKLTRGVRDALVAFDPEHHLPRSLRERFGSDLASRARKTAKAFGNASRTIGQVNEMLKSYQPFVHDDDMVFRTDRVRALGSLLSSEEHALFAYGTESLDWRHYWMEVEIPGLDRWSLPLLRGERAPEDPDFAFGAPLRETERWTAASIPPPMAALTRGEEAAE